MQRCYVSSDVDPSDLILMFQMYEHDNAIKPTPNYAEKSTVDD